MLFDVHIFRLEYRWYATCFRVSAFREIPGVSTHWMELMLIKSKDPKNPPLTHRQQALRRDISHLLEGKYNDVSYNEVMAVFARLLQKQGVKSNQTPLSSWQAVNGVRYFFGEKDGVLLLGLEPQESKVFSSLYADVHGSRALMVDLPTPLPLNSDIAVCVILSVVDLEIWYQGRVVHVTESGTVLTLEPLTEEHATWWAVGKRAFAMGTLGISASKEGPKSSPPVVLGQRRQQANKGLERQVLQSSRNIRTVRRTTRKRSLARRLQPTSGVGKKKGTTLSGEGLEATSLYRMFIDKKSMLSGANHFEMLDLHWSAFSDLVRKAYERDMSRLKVENFPVEKREEYLTDIGAIRDAVERAYEVLKDERRRRLYRASKVNPYQIQSAVDLYLDKGRTALIQNDPLQASECYRRVLELDPTHDKARSRLTESSYQKA